MDFALYDAGRWTAGKRVSGHGLSPFNPKKMLCGQSIAISYEGSVQSLSYAAERIPDLTVIC